MGESDLPENEEADALANDLEAKLQVEEDGDGKKDSKKKKASPAPLPPLRGKGYLGGVVSPPPCGVVGGVVGFI